MWVWTSTRTASRWPQPSPGRVSARLVGKVVHDVPKLLKVLAKVGTADQLHIVYEAGPTGFGLQRALAARGYMCEVIASSKTPRRAGDRIKTDARDSIQLAEYSRSGDLSAVWIPDPADEAIRDLSRAREDAVNSRTQARHQLKGFLLRHDVRYTGKTSWCGVHDRWLARLTAQQRQWLKRRQAVEPTIGHLKQDHRMDRCIRCCVQRVQYRLVDASDCPAGPRRPSFLCTEWSLGL